MGRRTSTEAAHAALPDPMRSAVDAFARHLASERGRSTHTVRAYVADVVSLWPRIGAGIARDLDGSGANSLVVGGQFLLLLHPARHFFVALGPAVSANRSSEGSGQTFHYTEGFSTGIGGWW